VQRIYDARSILFQVLARRELAAERPTRGTIAFALTEQEERFVQALLRTERRRAGQEGRPTSDSALLAHLARGLLAELDPTSGAAN
jgi:hypothetical protein